jgi:iron complex transport system substrate-binding protein
MKWLLLAGLLFPFTSAAAQPAQPVCAPGTRPIEHALGETCVPEAPQRVVSLDMSVTELMLIAGTQPVAVSGVVLDAYTRMHPELEATFAELLETADDTGFPPNIEVILQAQPDLIIAPRDLFIEGLYPELNAIAPTVLYEPAPGDWRARLRFAASVLGHTELVETLIADFEARLDEVRALLGETAEDTTVSLVRTFPDQIGLVLEGTAGAALLNEVGLARPEAQRVDYEYVLNELDGRPELLISEEELALADADVVFVFGDAPTLFENALWGAMPAVRAGQVFEVGYYWWGDSLLSAHDMLDDLFLYVAGVEPELPNPFEAGIAVSSEADG